MKFHSWLIGLAAAAPILSGVASAQRVEVDQAVARQYKQTLLSGSDIVYPAEPLKLKQGGTGVFVMFLRPDGTVKSVNTQRSTGNAILDAETKRTLLTYRFKPGTIPTQVFPVTFNPHKY
jgi:TonB family protein